MSNYQTLCCLIAYLVPCRREFEIDHWITHEFRDPDKVSEEKNFDIALVKLKTEVDISIHTPVCLPVRGEDYISPDRQTGDFRWGTATGKYS